MRPVLAKVATLEEVRRRWTLKQLFDIHEALDIQAEAEQFEYDRASKR